MIAEVELLGVKPKVILELVLDCQLTVLAVEPNKLKVSEMFVEQFGWVM